MKKIFVGNLDFSVTEAAVRALFEPYGAVDRVSLMTNRDTGRSRGFAFVEMSNSSKGERRDYRSQRLQPERPRAQCQ
jgi:RNA recognition motif-containing protein